MTDPNYQPHVLVITGDTADEREWEIEHPDCPRVCHWWPGAAEAATINEPWFNSDRDGHPTCYVQFEIDNAGLDSLDGDSLPFVDGNPWGIDRWRLLEPGRYTIEGWYTAGGWTGADPVDPDGGLTLIGRAA